MNNASDILDALITACDLLDAQDIPTQGRRLHPEHAASLLLDDIPLQDGDADVVEFLHLIREGDTPPLDLVARLMDAGYDVEALEASVPV